MGKRRQFLCAWGLGLVSLLASRAGLAEIRIHAPTEPPFREIPATRETIDRLRQGGFVLYIRHGFTDNSRPDQEDRIDLADCSTQRVLSDAGRTLMKEVGQAIRAAGIPVGEILASPLCRAKESAGLVFQGPVKLNPQLMYWTRMSVDNKKPRLEALQRLLSAPVAKGSNRALVAHAPNLQDLIGLFVKPEGTVVIFSPKGNEGYEYVASIYPGTWKGLLK